MADLTVDEPRVLMVDDEKEVADAYALRLEGVADVTVAYGGAEALERVANDPDPDVVLLDRHMPDVPGDDVLAELDERGIRARVVMVTAIDPGLDVLDLPFDDYLCKPVDREDVHAVVDQQCRVLAYELLGDYFRAESKRAVIEAELPADRLADHEEFTALESRTAALRERLERLLPDAGRVLETFSGVGREGF
jgi:DNA-binding response OmpR family regulator